MSIESLEVTVVAPDTIRAILTANDWDSQPITSGLTHSIILYKPDSSQFLNSTSPADNGDGTYTVFFVISQGSDSGVYTLTWTVTKDSKPSTAKALVKVE